MPRTTTDIPTKPLDEITAFMRRFVVFADEDHATVLALWILHTWTFGAAYATPYLYVNSAEPQSGKTRVLEVCQLLARNAISNSNTSTAAMFRLIESQSPTLFLDEVDAVFTGAANEELRGVLNSGYKQGGSVMRFDGMDVARFSTFCPKMLVGIDNAGMPDTIRDRCIPIVLKRKKTDQEVERFVPRKIQDEADALRARIEAWATHNIERIMGAPDPKVIDGISDRSFEITEPLLILARICGAEKATREAILRLMAGKVPQASVGIQTLTAARELMDAGKVDRLSSAQLAAHMQVSPKKLGVILSPYGITPSTIRFTNNERGKGYYRNDFQDSWERYL